MNAIALIVVVAIAAAYLRRMERLHYLRNGVSFVLQNASGAISGIYSAWDVAVHGLEVTHALMAIMAGLYLLRSRETYVEEISKPMELREIDGRNLGRVSGGRKS